MNTKIGLNKYFTILGFALYFLILIGERVQSIVRSFVLGADLMFADAFSASTYVISIISVLAFVVYIIITNRAFFKTLIKGNRNDFEKIDFTKLCIASGILLVSGMVHTVFTISVIQFVAYGFIILSIILKTASLHNQTTSNLNLYLSCIYLIVFSMAIPVVYPTTINAKIIFYILEYVAMFTLVFAFTIMLKDVFTNNTTKVINFCSAISVLLFDTVLLVLRWAEYINTFLLIFAALTIVLYVIFTLVLKPRRK